MIKIYEKRADGLVVNSDRKAYVNRVRAKRRTESLEQRLAALEKALREKVTNG